MRRFIALLFFDVGCWLERLGTPRCHRDLLRRLQRIERHDLKVSFIKH